MATATVSLDMKSLECPICFDTYQDPRLLPCGHAICGPLSHEKCAENLDPSKTGEIKCPHCQADHKALVDKLPPCYKTREILESLKTQSAKPKSVCQEHGKETILRCVKDEKEVCVDCITSTHLGHEFEGIHEKEKKRLSDFWKLQKTELQGMQLKCRRRIAIAQKEAEFVELQLRQESSLDKNIGNLVTNRDAITDKLESKNFNPEDEDIVALKVFMDQLKATSDSQRESSQEVQRHNQEMKDLVDSRTATYCTQLQASQAGFLRLSKQSASALSPRNSVSTEEVFRKSKQVLSQQPQLATNILALGWEGNHHLLKLGDNTWVPWEGRRADEKYYYGVICFNMKVFIIGSRDGGFSTRGVDIYSIREKRWTKGPNLTEPRVCTSCCFAESSRSIFVCGGRKTYSVTSFLNSVEKLQLDENGDPIGEWTKVQPMKEKRTVFAAVAVDSRVYVIGGINEKNRNLSTVEVYDVNTGEWSYGPAMKQSRSYHAAVHYQKNIYVIGGLVSAEMKVTSSCEKLNLQSQTWMTIESMRNTRAWFGSVAANGKIYVAGGSTNGTREDNRSVEVYDIESNTWSLGPELPQKMNGTQCVSW